MRWRELGSSFIHPILHLLQFSWTVRQCCSAGRSLTRVENFLIKVPFATEWEVLPADRPNEQVRERRRRRRHIKCNQTVSETLTRGGGNNATQHFCGGTNYIADIKGPTDSHRRTESISLGGRTSKWKQGVSEQFLR